MFSFLSKIFQHSHLLMNSFRNLLSGISSPLDKKKQAITRKADSTGGNESWLAINNRSHYQWRIYFCFFFFGGHFNFVNHIYLLLFFCQVLCVIVIALLYLVHDFSLGTHGRPPKPKCSINKMSNETKKKMNYGCIKWCVFSLLICQFFFVPGEEKIKCESDFNEHSIILSDNIINQCIISGSWRLHQFCHANQFDSFSLSTHRRPHWTTMFQLDHFRGCYSCVFMTLK